MKINLNDKEYGLHWGFGAIRIFCDAMECEYEAGMDMILGAGDYTILKRTKAVSMMVFAAIQNYANINDTDISGLTFSKIEAYRDDTPQNEFKKVMDDFMGANILGNTYRSYLGLTEETPSTTKKKLRSVKNV